MAEYPDVVDRIMDEIVPETKMIRPDLGEELAVDATSCQFLLRRQSQASLGPVRRVGNAL